MVRRLLGLLLLAMAAGQLSDLGGFLDILATYELGSTPVTGPLAAFLLGGELIAGTSLLASGASTRKLGSQAAVVISVGWSVLAVQAFARGLSVPNCGCFGVHLGQPLRWWVLLEDAELVALALWARRHTTRHLVLPKTATSTTGF